MSEAAFHRFLEWLDEGVDSGGQKYLEMRRRLTTYFDRHNCPSPDDLADETLNRVARRLEEEGEIQTTAPARYCYITAKFVLLERARESERAPVSLETLSPRGRERALASDTTEAAEEARREELRMQCLETCLEKLDPEQRELIFGYYQGEQRVKIDNRRRLAELFRTSINALSIRACRIRSRLEECVRKRMDAAAQRLK